MAGDSARISPTALFTSYVWYAHGLSHEALTFPLGKMAYQAFRPFDRAYAALGRANLEMMLLARHKLIDSYLEAAIAEGVTQVVEIAAGYSPRGWRMTSRHPGLSYIEADLPHVALEKRARLDAAGLRGPRHDVVELDALADDGPLALPALFARRLDARAPTVIITEGLLGYFDQVTVEALWRRIAKQLRNVPFGYYFADINVKGDVGGRWAARAFRRMLELVARGGVYLHYPDARHLEAALRAAGFSGVAAVHPREAPPTLELPRPESQLVRIIRANVGERAADA